MQNTLCSIKCTEWPSSFFAPMKKESFKIVFSYGESYIIWEKLFTAGVTGSMLHSADVLTVSPFMPAHLCTVKLIVFKTNLSFNKCILKR